MLLHHLHGLKTYSVNDDPLLEKLDGFADAAGHEILPVSIDELCYEDLVADPQGEVCRVLNKLGISGCGRGDAAFVSDFASLNRLWPQFFRQGRSGTWRSVMTPRLERLFWINHRQGMEKLGYQ